MSDTLNKIEDIRSRLDHLEEAGTWLARALVHADATASHTGTLVTVLAEDIREKFTALVAELEADSNDKNKLSLVRN